MNNVSSYPHYNYKNFWFIFLKRHFSQGLVFLVPLSEIGCAFFFFFFLFAAKYFFPLFTHAGGQIHNYVMEK